MGLTHYFWQAQSRGKFIPCLRLSHPESINYDIEQQLGFPEQLLCWQGLQIVIKCILDFVSLELLRRIGVANHLVDLDLLRC